MTAAVRNIGCRICYNKTQAELEAKGVKFTGQPRLVEATQRMLSNTVDPNGWDVQLAGKPD